MIGGYITMIDVIIIGAGPAGVSAALYVKARGKNVLLLEKDKIGGLIANVSKVSHYLSLDKDETGPSFAKKLADQLAQAQIPVHYEEVLSLKKEDPGFLVQTSQDSYRAEKVICASGSSLKDLPLRQEEEIPYHHWPLGQEDQVKGKIVLMNGGSDGACKEALYLAKYAKEVHIIQVQEDLLCIHEFRERIEQSPNIFVHTSAQLESVKVKDGLCLEASFAGQVVQDPQGLEIYVQIGQNGNTGYLKDLANLEGSFVKEDLASSLQGLYFAGDLRVKAVKQVATAVSDGCLAGIQACK